MMFPESPDVFSSSDEIGKEGADPNNESDVHNGNINLCLLALDYLLYFSVI